MCVRATLTRVLYTLVSNVCNGAKLLFISLLYSWIQATTKMAGGPFSFTFKLFEKVVATLCVSVSC